MGSAAAGRSRRAGTRPERAPPSPPSGDSSGDAGSLGTPRAVFPRSPQYFLNSYFGLALDTSADSREVWFFKRVKFLHTALRRRRGRRDLRPELGARRTLQSNVALTERPQSGVFTVRGRMFLRTQPRHRAGR